MLPPGAAGGGRNDPGEAGGSALGGFTPLEGGCAGGGTTFEDLDPDFGGGGGGAVQIASNTSVAIDGIIHVGGGGGQTNSGGGAGGLVIVEAPTLTLGEQGGIAANGGGGGGECPGDDATPDAMQAAGGSADGGCDSPEMTFAGGSGATEVLPAVTGTIQQSQVVEHVMFGGGGGAVGRAHLSTLDSTYTSSGSTLLTVTITSDMVVTQ
jgi:hypothetical protein